MSADTTEDQEALDRFISRIGGGEKGSLRILIISFWGSDDTSLL
ncbi:hypothetical protein M079_1895 [Bacteroides fragilis str. 3996 N(B) 6]|nr:hypothetical protein M079_1895 [Bacteroides fragilis str. 3996 N(B) 6]